MRVLAPALVSGLCQVPEVTHMRSAHWEAHTGTRTFPASSPERLARHCLPVSEEGRTDGLTVCPLPARAPPRGRGEAPHILLPPRVMQNRPVQPVSMSIGLIPLSLKCTGGSLITTQKPRLTPSTTLKHTTACIF